MCPARLADRAWFVNDRINLRATANRQLVVAELESPNIAFGVHRWFAGGCSPDLLAIATPEQWETELERGRPGDNLMLLSLRRVSSMAMAHVGELTSAEPPITSESELERIRAFLADGRHEIAVIHRLSPRPEQLVCRYETLCDPQPEEWGAQMEEWSEGGGELFFFDNEIVWRGHQDRVWKAVQLPEEWAAQHGLYLVDGYLPDEQGRVVCGGPY